MPRCRPGPRSPEPVAVTSPDRCAGRTRTTIRRREDRPDDAPVGVAHPRCGPSTPSDRPANRAAVRGGSVASVPAPSPLTSALPKRGTGPFSGLRHPKVTSARPGSPVPVGVALSGTGDRLQTCITPGQGVFCNAQGSPQNFLVTHRNRMFIHRSCTTLPTRIVTDGEQARLLVAHDVHRAVDGRGAVRLNGRRDLADRCRCPRDHHHSVVHVAQPACTSKPPSRAASCVLGPGGDRKVQP